MRYPLTIKTEHYRGKKLFVKTHIRNNIAKNLKPWQLSSQYSI